MPHSQLALRDERLVALLATGTWLAEGIGTFDAIAHYDVAPYTYLVGVFASLGMAGGLMYFFGLKRWRALLVIASGAYLVLYGIRYFALSVSWQLDHRSVAEALLKSVDITSQLIQHTFSKGWYLNGFAITFYEWFMPICQAIILLALLRLSVIRHQETNERDL